MSVLKKHAKLVIRKGSFTLERPVLKDYPFFSFYWVAMHLPLYLQNEFHDPPFWDGNFVHRCLEIAITCMYRLGKVVENRPMSIVYL